MQENDELDRLDLWGAQLNEINWSKRIRPLPIKDINLMGTYLNNASFAEQEMFNCNFYGCHLREANFTKAILFEIKYESAILIKANFSFCDSQNLFFLDTDLTEAIFYKGIMTETKAQTSRFRKVDFRNTQWNDVDFERVDLTDSIFDKAQMIDGMFNHCDFSRVSMVDVNLQKSHFDNSRFINATLVNVNFDGVSLKFVNLANANLTGASNLTDKQLRSALSLRNTILPNGTRASDIPIISNGDANCNKSITMNWQIDYGTVEIQKDPDNSANCRFIFTDKTQISQRIKVFKYAELISMVYLKYTLYADLLQNTQVKLIQLGVGNEFLNEYLLTPNVEELNGAFETMTFWLNISVQSQSINDNQKTISIWDNLTLIFDIRFYDNYYPE